MEEMMRSFAVNQCFRDFSRLTSSVCFVTCSWSWIQKICLHSRCSGFGWNRSGWNFVVSFFYDGTFLACTRYGWIKILFVRPNAVVHGKTNPLSRNEFHGPVQNFCKFFFFCIFHYTGFHKNGTRTFLPSAHIFHKQTKASCFWFSCECLMVRSWVDLKVLRARFPQK